MNKQEFISDLSNFKRELKKVSESWDKNYNGNDLATMAYPFDEPFDTIVSKLTIWIDEAIDEIKEDTIELKDETVK